MANLAYLEIRDLKGISQIKGEKGKPSREKMHPVTAFHHKIAREIDPLDSDPGHLRVHSEFVVQKELDGSSHWLHHFNKDNKALGLVNLHLYHMPYSGSEERYLTIVLHNARIVEVEMVLPPVNLPENATVKEYAKISFIYDKIGFQSHDVLGTRPGKKQPAKGTIHDVTGLMSNAVFNYDWAEENAKGLALQALGELKKFVTAKLGKTATGSKVDEFIKKVGFIKLYEAIYKKTPLPPLPIDTE